MNIFERATRNKVRFETVRGMVTIEDLWDMPLLHKSGFCLDDLAKSINRELKQSEEESFVTKTPENSAVELKMEIVKYIIDYKLKKQEVAKKALETKEQKAKILDILAKKRDKSLESKSEEELLKMLDDM